MTPETPVWLLDVDGVINAASGTARYSAWPKRAWLRRRVRSAEFFWTIRAAGPVLDFIRRVHDKGLAEIRWHTTWQANAANISRAFKLPHFPVHDCPEFDDDYFNHHRYTAKNPILSQNLWWKYPAALRVVEDEGRQLIWTDDDAQAELAVGLRLALDKPGRDALVIAPQDEIGLTPTDLRSIATFLGRTDVLQD